MAGVAPRAFDDNVISLVIGLKELKKSANDPNNYRLIDIVPIVAK